MFQWIRLPDKDVASTASNDTTETQIGTGFQIPPWAKSIKAIRIAHTLLALTTNESVSGYLRLNNDGNDLEPFYLPLPLAQTLTGAIGTHMYEPIVYPTEIPVTVSDYIRAYCAYDKATTGVHTMTAYALLTDQAAKFTMHAQKSALQTLSTTEVTMPTVQTINTIANKTSGILGMWGYHYPDGGITAAQTATGYMLVRSNAQNWIDQRIPLNLYGSGLSTQITAPSKPVFASTPFWDTNTYEFSGITKLAFPSEFPIPKNAQIGFDFYGLMDGVNTSAPKARYGLMWHE
jgi:hypothetical protein